MKPVKAPKAPTAPTAPTARKAATSLLPRNVVSIASNEIRQRFRSKAFRIGFGVMAVMVALAASLPGLLAKDPKPETFRVATLGSDVPDVVRGLVTVKFQPVTTRAEGVRLVEDRTVDALVTTSELVVNTGLDLRVSEIVDELHGRRVLDRRARENQVAPQAVEALLEPIDPLRYKRLDPSDKVDGKSAALGSITQVLLLMAISIFGSTVLNGVLQEKSSRVVEVILSTVTTRQLLAGKLLGIGLFGFAQVLALGVLGFVLSSVVSGTKVPSSTGLTIVTFVVCFLFGFAFYASLFAAAGALASRIEDAQAVATPISLLLTVAYGVASVVTVAPNTLFAKIATFVPPATPAVVIARVASGRITWFELILAGSLMILSVIGVVRFAARVYSGATLRTGAKVKLGDALRAANG